MKMYLDLDFSFEPVIPVPIRVNRFEDFL
jgi:hypothetical protein